MSVIIRNHIEEIDISNETEVPTVTQTIFVDHNQDTQTQTNLQYFQKPNYTCEKCGISVTSRNVLTRHLSGRKHIQRVAREGKTFECDLCEIVANGQTQLEAHLRSSRHKMRLYRKEHGHEIFSKGALLIIVGIGTVFIVLLTAFKILL